jgi:hypothetical protein
MHATLHEGEGDVGAADRGEAGEGSARLLTLPASPPSSPPNSTSTLGKRQASTEAQMLKLYTIPMSKEDAFFALFWHGDHSYEDLEKHLFEWSLKDVLPPTIVCVESTSLALNAMSLAMYSVPGPNVMRALYTKDRMDVRSIYSMVQCMNELTNIKEARLLRNGALTLDFAIALFQACMIQYKVAAFTLMRPGCVYMAQLKKHVKDPFFVLLMLVECDGEDLCMVNDSNRRDKQVLLTSAEFARFLCTVDTSKIVTVFDARASMNTPARAA